MNHERFFSRLKEVLLQPLPGPAAQNKMSSLARIRDWLNMKVPSNARRGAVLLLMFPDNGSLSLVLMQRPDYNGVHGGQISLPGGKMELQDQTLADTALRESKEEIGIDPERVTLLGELTPLYIPPSNFHITPFIGSSLEMPEFRPDTKEVENIIVIPLNKLLSENSIQQKGVKTGLGFKMQVPSYFINGNVIWGATAMILSEFKEIILTMGDWDQAEKSY